VAGGRAKAIGANDDLLPVAVPAAGARRLSPLDAGLLLLPPGFTVMATPMFASRLTTRHGPRVVAAGSLAATAGGVLWMSRWGLHGSVIVQQTLPSMLFAAGASVCFFAITVMLTSEIEVRHSGLGSGLLNAGRQIGASIGLAVLTVVAAAHTRAGSGDGGPRAATASGYGFALTMIAGLAVAGILLIALHAWRRDREAAAQRAAETEHPVVEAA